MIQALTDPSWIEAMQDKLLQFKLQKVWTLVDLPYGKRAIRTKWVYKNKKDERGIMSSIGELTFFLGLQVTQKDDGIFISQDKYVDEILKKFGFLTVKTTSTPIETSKPLLKDAEVEDVDVHLYRSMIGSLMISIISRLIYCCCILLMLRFPMNSPFNLGSFFYDSDYAGASLDRKSTIGGCQFLRRRLISWQCKKQTIVATSTTKAEYTLIELLLINNGNLEFCDKHNMVAYLKKPFGSEGFQEMVDFLNGSHIRYALTKNLTIYVSLIKKVWQTATVRRVNNREQEITAIVDGKEFTVTEV
ncbi:hypothetical protein Tco_0060263 [Tanacetum coccineum]